MTEGNETASFGRELQEEWNVIPGASVTLHFLLCCKEHARLINILKTLETARFCFREVFIVLDVPHGGKYHHKTKGGPGGTKAFLAEPEGRGLVCEAERMAAEAAQLLRKRCPRAPTPATWQLEVMDYDSKEYRQELLEDYALSIGAPNLLTKPEVSKVINTTKPDEYLFRVMWRNSFIFSRMLKKCKGNYVFHSDSSYILAEFQERGNREGFMERSIGLMRSDDRMYMVAPQVCSMWESEETRNLNQPIEGRWGGAPPAKLWRRTASDAQSLVSHQQFIVDVARFKALYPLSHWRSHGEHIWSIALNKRKNAAFFVYIDENAVFANSCDGPPGGPPPPGNCDASGSLATADLRDDTAATLPAQTAEGHLEEALFAPVEGAPRFPRPRSHTVPEVDSAFNKWDIDGDGAISRTEFELAFLTMKDVPGASDAGRTASQYVQRGISGLVAQDPALNCDLPMQMLIVITALAILFLTAMLLMRRWLSSRPAG